MRRRIRIGAIDHDLERCVLTLAQQIGEAGMDDQRDRSIAVSIARVRLVLGLGRG